MYHFLKNSSEFLQLKNVKTHFVDFLCEKRVLKKNICMLKRVLSLLQVYVSILCIYSNFVDTTEIIQDNLNNHIIPKTVEILQKAVESGT